MLCNHFLLRREYDLVLDRVARLDVLDAAEALPLAERVFRRGGDEDAFVVLVRPVVAKPAVSPSLS